MKAIYLGFLLVTFQLCADAAPSILGKIDFPTSAALRAQPHFHDGILWLHNFEYDQARTEFQKAKELDPDFALAYWGEAMTYNHPLWGEEDLASAQKVLTTLANTDEGRIDKAKTTKEKGYIHAINFLFGDGTKAERNEEYLDAMRDLYQKFPSDDEIALFYALALLGADYGHNNIPTRIDAAAIAEDVFERNPEHPGAMHYAIHAYDDPEHAPLGLRFARLYPKIAPAAAHALHMPSHIFVELGLWNDMIASNKAAWESSLKKTGNGKQSYHDFHSLQWLVYGYLQKQEFQSAYDFVKTMGELTKKNPTTSAKSHYALMKADYLTESQNWNAPLASIEMNDMDPATQATQIYADALVQLNSSQGTDLTQPLQQLKELSELMPREGSITPNGKLIAKIYWLELQAQIEWKKNHREEALSLLLKAALIEDQVTADFGPPNPVKPSHELLADFLLADKRYKEAYEEYVIELKRAPHRTLSQQGLMKAKSALEEEGKPLPPGIRPYFNRLLQQANDKGG
jgi:hypothetical protein